MAKLFLSVCVCLALLACVNVQGQAVYDPPPDELLDPGTFDQEYVYHFSANAADYSSGSHEQQIVDEISKQLSIIATEIKTFFLNEISKVKSICRGSNNLLCIEFIKGLDEVKGIVGNMFSLLGYEV